MTRARLTAEQRSEQVIQAAVTVFAATGYEAGKTDEIARLVGVSQPYVVRLFGTKQRLFLAACERACDRIEQLFRDAAAESPDLATVGSAYDTFLAEPELPMLLLHGFAASSDPAIGDPMRARYGAIYQLIRDLTGATVTEAREFMSMGMLLTVMTALGVTGPNAVPEPWAVEMLSDCEQHGLG